jgi:hypothetical protein
VDEDQIAQLIGGGVFAFLGVIFLCALAATIATVAGMWKTFEKAGKPGWAAIIPIYNMIVVLEITGRPIWWIFLFLIPLANIVFGIIIHVDLAKSFGQGVGFAIGLLLLSFVFYPILGFGDYKYLGPAVSPTGPALAT